LSDDVIVERLRKADVVVARRTVAKYRDSLRIPSSVERRKLKMASARAHVRRHDPLSVDA
jgi:RNA polymerase sigma-54 factor